MIRRSWFAGIALVVMLTLAIGTASAAPMSPAAPRLTLLAKPMAKGFGSTVGPDGALYVTDTVEGRVLRVDPATGTFTTFASGLPKLPANAGDGGALDVAFIGNTAYVLVTEVDPYAGGNSIDGIYRVDGPGSFTIIADLGDWSLHHPPATAFELPTGVQFAMQPYRGGFLVTDGHHNRVLKIGLDGAITQLIQFADVVPTGLALQGNRIYVAQAGPVPHLPENGKIVSFTEKSPRATQVAAGAPLLVDVEFGPGHGLYAMSQGHFTPGQAPGSPADANTGSLVVAGPKGGFTTVIGGLNQPTSLEFIGNTAYVVTLTGEIWKIENIPAARAAWADGRAQASGR